MIQSEPQSTKRRMNVLHMDVISMKKELTARNITSKEITRLFIEHLQHVNPKVNCLVEDRFSEAMKEAEEADRLIQSGNALGRLAGIPISIKESFHVKGMKTTGGLKHRSHIAESADARVVEILRNEGAIILGKTNTPTLCFCQETDNKVYGTTNNPWDIDRTAGGSSGGEGALIALGGATAGIGSDIGGSIRFPAHFNGVIGFKSGNERIDDEGSYPEVVHRLQKRMLGIGPMVKSVRDARFIYKMIASHDYDSSVEMANYVIQTLPKNSYILSEIIENKIQKVIDFLNTKLQVATQIPPYFEESSLLWQEIMSIDGGKSTADAAGFTGIGNVLKNYLKEKLTGKSDYHHYMTWALIGASLFKPGRMRVAEIRRLIEEGDRQIKDYFDRRILILPVYHRTAPHHGDLYSEIFSIKKTFKKYMPFVAYANVWGLPSLTVPVGMDEDRLPMGIQLISNNGNEEALFQLGELIEREFGGYERCVLHDKEIYM
ncbi:amidase [Siminovitchia acidinfaciens]|uniref:Amidase n=1 Tax=Siminovitchia acidinfaciens TaxID=2321395 RepID=A0A429XXB7_9BACI|nr:amidase [Siminovitchia acidinfaciens]RST73116.1 amidase [Siminovitchia acidinfaciens]